MSKELEAPEVFGYVCIKECNDGKFRHFLYDKPQADGEPLMTVAQYRADMAALQLQLDNQKALTDQANYHKAQCGQVIDELRAQVAQQAVPSEDHETFIQRMIEERDLSRTMAAYMWDNRPTGWRLVPTKATPAMVKSMIMAAEGYEADICKQYMELAWEGGIAAAPQRADHSARSLDRVVMPVAQVCKLGLYGKAYDLPGDHRAYTYSHQPDNGPAWKLGDAVSSVIRGGDYIDTGLSLLKQLQDRGMGVFEIAADASQEANKEDNKP